MTETCSKK